MSEYNYPSPLSASWKEHPALSFTDPKNFTYAADGKAILNPHAESASKSAAYEAFPDPITNGIRGGFDVHIYYNANNPVQAQFAEELWRRIRLEFPELRIYRLWDRPIGPHVTAMFEVNLFNPKQFGAFVPWLVVNRGPCSALVHPNTGDDLKDHGELGTWLGEKVPIDFGLLKVLVERGKKAEEEKRKKEEEGLNEK